MSRTEAGSPPAAAGDEAGKQCAVHAAVFCNDTMTELSFHVENGEWKETLK